MFFVIKVMGHSFTQLEACSVIGLQELVIEIHTDKFELLSLV